MFSGNVYIIPQIDRLVNNAFDFLDNYHNNTYNISQTAHKKGTTTFFQLVLTAEKHITIIK